jgi:shikimate kinase
MRIYLTGYMGSGKSTLGRKLARHAGLQFVDMDHYIEKRNCKSVPRIFAEEGEAEFRKKERKALEELSEFTDVVVATGGGAPCFFDNMDIMNRTGITIFLNIDPKILANRLLESKTERPLIKGKSKEELVQFIGETLEKRKEFYTKAKYQITQPDMDLIQVMHMINQGL